MPLAVTTRHVPYQWVVVDIELGWTMQAGPRQYAEMTSATLDVDRAIPSHDDHMTRPTWLAADTGSSAFIFHHSESR